MNEFPKLLRALMVPLVFVIIIWIIKVTEEILILDFYKLGIYPLTLSGLKGVIFSPLLHGSFRHLISNTVPLLVLGWALFFFYRELGIRITLLSWVMSGLWVWVFARESYHIGASSIIYSWAAFLFVSGVIRKHPRLMALSLLVTFLYGSMIWGIFPLKERISWEGHLMGMLAGIILAVYYRNTGPQRKKYSWEIEPEHETDSEEEEPYWMEEEAERKIENEKGNEN
jgi:membrane associated rhomboid family serine protease